MEDLKDYLNKTKLVAESNRPKKDYENAHSDRLAKILSHKDSLGKFQVLQLFVNEFFFMKDVTIYSPQITRGDENIDILVTDSFYSIIFENKVNYARDQHHQIVRYVDTIRKRGYRLEDIYVVYLQEDRSDQPEKQTFGAYFNDDTLMDNFYLIPCRPNLLDWLEIIQSSNVIADKDVQKALNDEIKYLTHLSPLAHARMSN